jgi:hypothetical protein
MVIDATSLGQSLRQVGAKTRSLTETVIAPGGATMAVNPQSIVSVELQGWIGNQMSNMRPDALARRTGAASTLDRSGCERRRRCLRLAGNPESEGAALRRRTRLLARDRGQSGLVGTNE